MQTLRRQVQLSRDKRITKPDESYVRELQLTRLIGKGGFGTVYAGTWQGSPVAFKASRVAYVFAQCVVCAEGSQHVSLLRAAPALSASTPAHPTGHGPLLNSF
jgi:hypothetical protein